MGMDVYGRNPKNEVGEYFRRNVWGWHPLWDYCLDMHQSIAGKVECGHSNEGDGLGSVDATSLGKKLKLDVESGVAQEYIDARNEALASLKKELCSCCQGDGKIVPKATLEELALVVSTNAQEVPDLKEKICHVCSGEGYTENWAKNYFLRLEDISEFAEFLVNSGGFNIH